MAEKYPLEQLAEIKKRRLEEAEKLLKKRREELEAAQAELKKREEERDLTRTHKQEKLKQLREMMDEGEKTTKIQSQKVYLKTVDVELKQKQDVVEQQKKKVEAAEKAVEAARQDMIKKNQEVEKLRLHKTEWEKGVRLEEIRIEGIESDELGSAMYNKRKKEENG